MLIVLKFLPGTVKKVTNAMCKSWTAIAITGLLKGEFGLLFGGNDAELGNNYIMVEKVYT